MNPTQLQTTLAPIVSFFAGLLAAKVPWLDAGAWTQIIGGILAVAGVIWGAVAAKPSSLAATTQTFQGVNVTTDQTAAPTVAAAVDNAKH